MDDQIVQAQNYMTEIMEKDWPARSTLFMGITATIISSIISPLTGDGGVFTQANNNQTEKMVMYTIITKIKLLVVNSGSESRTGLTKFK